MAWDERTGDGHHRRAYGERIDALTACRNDHELGFVSRMCGYESLSVFREDTSREKIEMLGACADTARGKWARCALRFFRVHDLMS